MKRLIYLSLLLAAASANAQDLSTEITVDRTIVPAERAATRLNSVHPAIKTTSPAPVRLDMAEYCEPGTVTRSARILAPAAWADTFALSPYRGYVAGGYFPVYNLGLSAGYRIINSADTRLGVHAEFTGYSYSRKGYPYEDEKYTFKNNTVSVGADFDRRFGRAGVLTVNAAYSYGRIAAPDMFCARDHGIGMADVSADWYGRAGRTGYHAGAGFHTFSYNENCDNDPMWVPINPTTTYFKKGTEMQFTVAAGVMVPFGDEAYANRAGIELEADMLSRPEGTVIGIVHAGSGALGVVPAEGGTLGILSATPYYALGRGNGLNLRLGARIDISTGGSGKKFHIAPAVSAAWSTGGFSLYARAGGGEVQNTQRSLYEYSPFVPVGMLYGRSHIPLTVDAGVNIGPFAGIGVEIFGGWARANDWLMPSLVEFSGPAYALFTPEKVKGAHAGVRASYKLRSMLDASVSVEFAPQNENSGYYLWRDRAKMVIKADVRVRPIEKLELNAGFELRADRGCYYFSPSEGNAFCGLGDARLLDFGARYDLTPALSLFARADNILGSDHFILPYVPAQGVHGLIGASFKF